MPKKELQKLGDELFYATEQIVKGLSDAREGYLHAGKWLTIVKMKKLWKGSGSHVKTYEAWVENELGLKKSTAYNITGVYDKYGDLLENSAEFRSLEFSKIVELLPYTKDDTPLSHKEELLRMCKDTTRRGLKDNLREMAGKEPSDSTKCTHENTKTITICLRCKAWLP